jgi:predicted TIM-barrel fold metal-dependent hydrolase
MRRVVDAHVHFWDPANVDWYPYLAPRIDVRTDTAAKSRFYDPTAYRAESARWNVEKVVHIAAATAPHYVAETSALERLGERSGFPTVIIGGITLSDPVAAIEDVLDRQMASARFRGVRPMGGVTEPPTREVLRAVSERDLVFEILARPDELLGWARALEGCDDLTVVVEHAGWPRSNTAKELVLCRRGIEALAALGDHVHCKVSGLSVGLGSMAVSTMRPWIEHCLDRFGIERSFFASNFPVDAAHGTFDDLYSAFDTLTAVTGDAARQRMFASNAERLYRC